MNKIIPEVEAYASSGKSATNNKKNTAQTTCLLLLLLLKVPDLSTAFLMPLTFWTISLATLGFSASKSYLFVPPSLCTTSLKDEDDLADCWQATTQRIW